MVGKANDVLGDVVVVDVDVTVGLVIVAGTLAMLASSAIRNLPGSKLPPTVVGFLVALAPGIVSFVPLNIVEPPLYLGSVVSFGLAALIAATVVLLALAIADSV